MTITRFIPVLAALAVHAPAIALEVINYPEEPDPLKDHPLTEKVRALDKLNLEKLAQEARRLSPSERKSTLYTSRNCRQDMGVSCAVKPQVPD